MLPLTDHRRVSLLLVFGVLAGGPELAPATVFQRTAEGVVVAG